MTEAWEPELAPREGPVKSTSGIPIGLTIAAILAFALLVGLGVWQVKRLAWKEALLAHVEALKTSQATPLGPVLDRLSKGEDVGFTRVSVTCPGLATAPFLELYGLRDGQAGSRLVSACEAPSLKYRTILVDRGFVGDTVAARPPVDAADRTPVELVGVLRTPDKRTFVTPVNRPERWYSRDIPAMAATLKAPSPAPIFLFAETPTNPQWKALVPAPLPGDIPNRHLEYAITWFSLAGALAAVYAAMLFRRLRS